MKRVGKPVFFIVVALITILTLLSFFGFSTQFGDIKKTYVKGASEIRWGIDIRGGVDVTFCPPDGVDATDDELASAKAIVETRLVSQHITDYELYVDNSKDRIIVRFPWKADETDFDPEAAIAELGETALLTFREGNEQDENGAPSGTTKENIILEGKDVVKAEAVILQENNQPAVSLEFTDDGAKAFAEATKELANSGYISIWMDDVLISAPFVESEITDGKCVINGSFTTDEAKELADKINAGALPFELKTESFSTISPTLGSGAKDAMVLAGAIAFALVAIYIIVLYRLPGVVAVIALAGQVAGTVAALTGFFPGISSFTLTLPGLAGIILSIGVGVDANIITAERIKEELRNGKTLDGAIDSGFARGWTAIFDSNITVIFVAVILMGVFGPPDGLFATLLKPVLFFFGPSTTGAIYSFGYTLLVGIILNFIMGVTASRLMLKSISKFKALRNPVLYGGEKSE